MNASDGPHMMLVPAHYNLVMSQSVRSSSQHPCSSYTVLDTAACAVPLGGISPSASFLHLALSPSVSSGYVPVLHESTSAAVQQVCTACSPGGVVSSPPKES